MEEMAQAETFQRWGTSAVLEVTDSSLRLFLNGEEEISIAGMDRHRMLGMYLEWLRGVPI